MSVSLERLCQPCYLVRHGTATDPQKTMTKAKTSRGAKKTGSSTQAGIISAAKPVRTAKKAKATPCVVGIGASAGGFEALRAFFKVMPADSGLAFVVIQHLDPTHESMASDVIGKWTKMPVVEATQGALLEADHVYTIPPNKYLTVKNGALQLIAPTARRGQRLPIDCFFDSLGADQNERAIGIVLSGTGSDGSLGLKSIERNGGIVLVQEPESAGFTGMPLSALATGLINYVLPVERMPKVLQAYAQHPYPAGLAPRAVADGRERNVLAAILDVVRARCNFSFSGYKRATLLRRIHRRMGLLHAERLSDYLALLKRQPEEVDALFKDLLINVTDFYRDPEAWKTLAVEVIRPMVRIKRQDEAIRVWVPACSTGEEAYSVAMLILDELREQKKHCPVMIFATDINEAALNIARGGSYPSGIVSHIPSAQLHRYFVEGANDRLYKVGQELRGALIFSAHNLVSDPPFSQLDLISCRNVLIYLEPEVQSKVLTLFRFALRPGGHLFLGSAETLGDMKEQFEAISKKWRIFRHISSARPARLDIPVVDVVSHEPLAPPPPLKAPISRLTQAAQLAQQMLLDQFAPASVLVNGDNQVLYYYGPTSRFLVQPRGAPTHDVLSQVRDGLRSRLRAALQEAQQRLDVVVVADARAKREGAFQPVKFTVVPLPPNADSGQLYMIVFEDIASPAAVVSGDGEGKLVRQLEDELRVTKDDLHGALERMEASNEELKISNEEVVSVNEELRSLNEELESSKEELQSLNEELSTVNQQLQAKVLELEGANSDMSNLLASSDIATLCLDRKLRIKWLTPGMQNVFNLIASDIGRPISDFSEALSGDGLIADAKSVLRKLAPLDREIRLGNGHWYIRRILPYRTEDDHIAGVTITFSDITESKRNSETLEKRVLERTAQLRALTVEVSLAEERERRALAQDLHDDLGQILAAAKIKLSTLSKLEHVADLKRRCEEVGLLLDRAHTSVRSLTFQLSPPVLFELGLIPAIEWLADEMRRTYELKVKVIDDGVKKPLDMSVSTILFRAVRELLINVAKHAKVSEAKVSIERVRKLIVIHVLDEGVGLKHPRHDERGGPTSQPLGYGLMSVRERLSYIGGDMHMESIPGDGTLVTLAAPLAATTRKPGGRK